MYKGRPRTLSVESVALLVQKLAAGEKPSALAREFGVSRMTLHRYRTRKSAGNPDDEAEADRDALPMW